MQAIASVGHLHFNSNFKTLFNVILQKLIKALRSIKINLFINCIMMIIHSILLTSIIKYIYHKLEIMCKLIYNQLNNKHHHHSRQLLIRH